MAVPKRKTTPSKRNMRRSHHGVKSTNIVEDKRPSYKMKYVTYPLFFVFLFFVFSWFSRVYKKAKAYSIIKNQ